MNKDLRVRLKGHERGEACRGGSGARLICRIFLRLVKGGKSVGFQGPYQVMPAWKSSLEEHVHVFHSANQISIHVLCISSAPRCSSD